MVRTVLLAVFGHFLLVLLVFSCGSFFGQNGRDKGTLLLLIEASFPGFILLGFGVFLVFLINS